MNSADKKNFYKENGYLVVENVIPEKECDEFIKICEDYYRLNNINYNEILQAHNKIGKALDFLKNPKVVENVENILEAEAVGVQTVCSFKKPGTKSAKYAWNPHQDNSYIKADKNSYVSGDIALDNHIENSGVLYVYPGSHNEELLPFEPHKSFDLEEGENPGNRVIEIPKKYNKVELYLRKGSLLMFHPLVIHGSYSNNTKSNWRPLLLMAYTKKGANFFEGKSASRKPIELKN